MAGLQTFRCGYDHHVSTWKIYVELTVLKIHQEQFLAQTEAFIERILVEYCADEQCTDLQ